MKTAIIHEIRKENSRIRVIFATSALGMGVDTPYVTQVIHVTPPANIESYMQEIGRAGRKGGCLSSATLYYNNSDIANNKKHIQDEMKAYCQSKQTCLRLQILQYLGCPGVRQERCCCICDGAARYANEDHKISKNKVRNLSNINRAILEEKLVNEIGNTVKSDVDIFLNHTIEEDIVKKIVEGVQYIETELDLLQTYGIWDETLSSNIFGLISQYAPLI